MWCTCRGYEKLISPFINTMGSFRDKPCSITIMWIAVEYRLLPTRAIEKHLKVGEKVKREIQFNLRLDLSWFSPSFTPQIGLAFMRICTRSTKIICIRSAVALFCQVWEDNHDVVIPIYLRWHSETTDYYWEACVSEWRCCIQRKILRIPYIWLHCGKCWLYFYTRIMHSSQDVLASAAMSI